MKFSPIVYSGFFLCLLSQNLYADVCKRTPQVRDAIVEQVTEILGREKPIPCNKITKEHLAVIRELDLSRRRMTTLRTHDLEGLSHLEYLDVGGNKLRELPENIFWHTPRLTELYLNDNNLAEITDSSLNGLHESLKFLSLEYNDLSNLTLEDFPHLEELYADGNKQIDQISFKHLPKLKRAFLKNNGLPDLDFGILTLPELEYADLSHNRLGNNAEKLKDMANLKTAMLDDNMIHIFPSALLYSGIEVLSLNSNRFTTESILSHLSPHADDNKKSVKALLINHSLSSPPSLEVINKLAEHDANLFIPVCRRTPQVRDALVDLLKIPCKKITRKDLARVESLELQGKNITSLHFTDFDGLSNLKDLELDFNELRRIPANTFAFASNLKSLTLDGNELLELNSSSLNGLQRTLEYLHVSHMKREAPLILEGLTALEFLNADQDGTTRKVSLKNLPVLKDLHLYDNGLFDLDFGLSDLPRLEYLNLARNHLRQIDELASVSTLREVLLYENKIETLPARLLSSGLERIDLTNNDIDLLPEIPADKKLSVKKLFLDKNPIWETEALIGRSLRPKWFTELEKENCAHASRILLIASD